LLHVPANVPVNQFLSLTAYDAKTAVFFENVSRPDISALEEGLQYNEDGSTWIIHRLDSRGIFRT
jgi:hypothetical protein